MSARRTPSGLAEWLFAIAMHAHPPGFRRAYGDQIRATFRDGRVAETGLVRRNRHLVRSILGAIATGLRQRWQRADEDPAPARGSSDGWLLDLRHALRSLFRRPSAALLIVATLAVGVGTNAAVFAALHSVVLSPLPYPEPERLVRLYQSGRESDIEAFGGYLTLPSVVHFRENLSALSAFAVVYTYESEGVDLTGGERPERLHKLHVSADYFAALGVLPGAGRPFRRDEERDPSDVAILRAPVAERLFGSAASAIGRSVTLDGAPVQVVGVMPRGFEDPLMGVVDVWLPLAIRTGGWEAWEWDNHYLSAIGRLAPGRTLEEARAELRHVGALQAEIAAQQLSAVGGVDPIDWRSIFVPLHDDVLGRSDTLLAILMGAVVLLLLLTCVNVSVLLVARSLGRTHEVAVRAALGSPRFRLARQLVIEGLMLGTAGGVIGLAIAIPLARLLHAIAPAGLLDRMPATPSVPVLAFGIGISLTAGTVFGLVPALRLSRVNALSALREKTRGSEGTVAGRARAGLVIVQVALALVLLIGAGVLLRSLARLQRLDLGMRPGTVMTFEVNLPESRWADGAERVRFHRELQQRLAALPGVRSAGALSVLPVTGRAYSWGAREVFGDESYGEELVSTDQRVVEGNVFETLGIAVLHGRMFGPGDDETVAPRVVINRALARVLFGDASRAAGGRVRVGGETRDVIGVAEDVPVSARGEVVPMIYHAHAQFGRDRHWRMVQLLDVRPGAGRVIENIVQEVSALDPDLVVYQPRPLAEIIGGGRAQERFAAQLVAGFAALAVLLAALGVYGVLAHSVRQRRREIGIRMALGARERTVLGMVVRQAMTLVVTGLVIGLLGAFVLTRWLSALVFDVGVRDPGAFTAAVAGMFLIALVACGLPAGRRRGRSRLES